MATGHVPRVAYTRIGAGQTRDKTGQLAETIYFQGFHDGIRCLVLSRTGLPMGQTGHLPP
jgi:hypothetical protein